MLLLDSEPSESDMEVSKPEESPRKPLMTEEKVEVSRSEWQWW